MGAIESKLLYLKLRFKSKLPHPHILKRYGKPVFVEDDYCYGDHLGLLDGYANPSCKFPVSNYYYDEDDLESDDERGSEVDMYEPLSLEGTWYKRRGWLE